MATRNVILLRGDAREESGTASETLTPGMLVQYDPSEPTGFLAHSEEGGPAAPWFVRSQHEHDGAGIHDTITEGDDVTILFPNLGAKINAYTTDTIVRGDSVESDGAGGVRAFGSGYRIGIASADSDLSGATGRVEIIIAPIGV